MNLSFDISTELYWEMSNWWKRLDDLKPSTGKIRMPNKKKSDISQIGNMLLRQPHDRVNPRSYGDVCRSSLIGQPVGFLEWLVKKHESKISMRTWKGVSERYYFLIRLLSRNGNILIWKFLDGRKEFRKQVKESKKIKSIWYWGDLLDILIMKKN